MNICVSRPLGFLRLGVSFIVLSFFLFGCGSSPVTSGVGGSSTVVTTPLAITAVSPKDVPVGSTNVSIVVSGTGFTSSSVIQLAGTSLPTTYVSSTELRATIPSSQMQTGVILKLSVVNGTQVVAADATNNVQVSNPVPTVTSLTPAGVPVGSPAGTITVNGDNFVAGITLAVNGSPRNTTFVSATQLTASLTASDYASAAPLLLNAVNPQPGGGASGTIALTVTNPAPTIVTVAPNTFSAGAAATTVTVTGSGFVAGTGVLVNGATRPVVVVNGGSLKVSLNAADLATAGQLAVTAVNPAPGGGLSGAAPIAVSNPAPGAITLTPASTTAGAGAAQITITGSNFVPSTVAYINGAARATTFVSTTQLVTALTTADLASAGTLSIAAVTPSPGGGSSGAVALAVNNPAPGAVTVTPNVVATGTTTETPITVTGANFMPSSVVQINGTARATTYISSTQLLSTLTVVDQATAGSLSVNVATPAPGGGVSSAASVAINNSALGAILLSPSTVPAGKTTSTVITVSGTGMVPGTGIQVNGSARATTYISANQVSFILLSSDVTTVGRLNVTAVNPAPNYSVSAVAQLTVATATANPVITSLTPTSAIVGSPVTTVNAVGTGFAVGCLLQWNSTTLSTSYIYGSYYTQQGFYTTGYSLYATIPATLLTTKGAASITANCPTALTPVSNAVTFNVVDPPVPTLSSMSLPNNSSSTGLAGPMGTDAKLTLYGTGFSAASTANFNGQPLTTSYSSTSTLTATIPASMVLFPGVGKVTVTTPAPGGGTSNALTYTTYAPITNNSMVYNPVNGLLYLSIPASVGAPYGNSVVSMDPATGALGTPIPVGSEPDKLAITSDGRYLWVALDGASGIRKVDLTTNTAGQQFALGLPTNSSAVQTVTNMLALPGASDSVIVLQGNNNYASALGIYDSGVARGTLTTLNYYSQIALRVDGSRNEIYIGGSGLYTFNYSSSGITAKASNTNYNLLLANSTFDEMQLANGKLYTDFGTAYDAESGSLLGTMYTTGTTVAQGPALLDTIQNKIFILNNGASSCCSGYNQIQVFNPADYSATGVTIPISVPNYIYNSSGNSIYLSPTRMLRWGSNGIAFRASVGVFTVESNGVKDMSSTVADLSVTAAASSNTTTGNTSTYTLTVTNNGPSTASDVAVAIQIPSTGILVSAATTMGSCATSTSGCNLGSVPSGTTATITVSVLQTTSGTATLTARVSGSTTDNNSSNDAGSASLTVTGSDFNLVPRLSSISPSAIRSGSADTTITVTGTSFSPGSAVVLGSTTLSTTYTSATTLTATVPAAQLVSMGWSPITVSSPTPGGGVSNSVPLTVYSVLSIGVNHVLYDPYSRKLMASVSTGSSTTEGKSLVAITPDTATVGTAIPLANVPTKLALSQSGQTLWIGNSTAASVARYDMLTGAMDNITIPTNLNQTYYPSYPTEIAVQPGTENTLAMAIGTYYYGTGIFDYSTTTRTLTARSNILTYSTFSCLSFLDPSTLFATNDSTSINSYTVNSSGLTANTPAAATLNRFNCFRIANGKAFASAGGVAQLTSGGGMTQIGSFTLPSQYYYNYGSGTAIAAPDVSLGQTFIPSYSGSSTYSNYLDGVISYDNGNYLRTGSIGLNIPTIEGSTNFTVQDMVRWGQDGLALVTSTGHIYLVRGPFVVPQMLNANSAATLTGASSTTIARGSGNTLLTVTGSNFVPGVAVNWNGSYRTTTIVDATHVLVAIPAADLAASGTASITAVNPGAGSSSAITITIQ